MIIGAGSNAMMYDGVTVSAWPANVQFGLVYTDGQFANATAAKTRFMAATFQTISAVGQVPADWVDCEPGCVWPPLRAVSLYKTWRPQGCRGVYFAESTRPQVVRAARQLGANPQLFGADWTGVPHIVPGETETQFQHTPGFDVSMIPGLVPPAPVPAPAPIPRPVKAEHMRVVVATSSSTAPPQHPVTAGQHFLVFDNALIYVIENQADIAAWIDALGPAVPLTGGFLGNIPLMP